MTTFFRIIPGLFILLALLPFAGVCQLVPAAPVWVQDIGGPNGNIISTIIKLDSQDNIYITGIYSGTVDFDPSAGVTNLTSVSGSFDGFVVKYTPAGGLVWARSFGGSQTDQPNGLDVDLNGNVTLIGQFNSTPMDADPGPGVFNLNATDRDAFIIKLDKNGNFLWARSTPNAGDDNGSKVVSDASGDLIAGYQYFIVNGQLNGRVVKYDPAGNVLWSFDLAATNGDNSVIGVVLDKNGNINISGYLNGTVNYDPLGTLQMISGNNSMFLAQYTPAGILNWVKVVKGNSPAYNYNVNLAMDAQNNIYMDGVFTLPLDFANGISLTPQGTQDIFVSKYSSTGVLQWARDLGGAGSFINNYGITVSSDNNVYLSGYFNGTVDLDPSAGVANIKDHGIRDMFLSKYDVDGNYQWAFGLGNNNCNNNLARYVAVNSANEVILSGSFCSTVNFDASGCSARNVTAQSGERDMFIAKYIPVVLNNDNTIIAPAVTGFCGSGDPEIITSNPPSAGSPNINYQWQSSADSITFTNINGATSKDYDPPFINTTTYYRRAVLAGTCLTPSVSNIVKISTTNRSDNVITGPVATKFCDLGQPVPISGSPMDPSFTYQWQISDDNQAFRNIGNAVSQDYRPPALSTVVYYYRRIVSGPRCAAGVSNVVSIAAVDGNTVSDNTITKPANTQFCGSGDPETITGKRLSGNSVAYQWEISADGKTFSAIPNATSQDYDPPPVMGTTNSTLQYRRTAFAEGCIAPVPSNEVTIVFSVLSKDEINAPAVTTFCGSGDPEKITGLQPEGGTGEYTYQWSSSTDNHLFTLIPGATGRDYDPPLLTTTTYFFRTVHSGNCEGTGTRTVAIIISNNTSFGENKISQPAPDGVLCPGDAKPGLISGSPPAGNSTDNNTYQWQSSVNDGEFTDIPGAINRDYDPPAITLTTQYRRLVTSGCTAISPSNVVTIEVATPITDNDIRQIVPNDPACSGPVSVQPIYGSTPKGGGVKSYSFLWQSSTDGKNFADIPNSNLQNYDPDEINTTTYYRRIVLSTLSCVGNARSNQVIIYINSPSANVITAPATHDFCGSGDPAPITSADPTGNDTYQWQSSADGNVFTDILGATSSNYDPPLLTFTTYYQRTTISGLCGTPSISNVVAINVNPEPVAPTSQAVSMCYGGSVTLTATGGTSYQWSPAAGLSATDVASPVASPTETTTYTVIISNGSCSVTMPVTVDVIQKPTVDTGPDKDVLLGSSVQLDPKVTGDDLKYSWSPATYLSDPNILDPIAFPTKNITYTLTVTTVRGECFTVSDNINLKVYENIVIPNTFTPNGDGTNDTWNITALNTYKNSTVTVYTRSGMVVYRSTGYSTPWDGTYKDQLVPFGSYYYIIDRKDGSSVLSGWLAIVR